MWEEKALSVLSEEKTYSRDDLFQALKDVRPELREEAFRWILYNLLKEKKISKVGYNAYITSETGKLPQYKPLYSQKAKALINTLKASYPQLAFVVFESVLLNEFLNHQIAQNTIYVQVEKDVSFYIFEILKEECKKGVLYNPTRKEFDKYWISDCVVVLDLISQSPLSVESPHEMTIEKMLVDIIAEKSMSATYSQSEIPTIYDNAVNTYNVDVRKMNRYAGRRGKTTQIQEYIGRKE